MRKLLAFLLFITLAGASCKKSEPMITKYITLGYRQTYCADPWPMGANDTQTLENVADYLEAEGLHVASLNMKQETSPDICLACHCKTGKTIYASILDGESLKAKYQEIGFKP